MTQITAARSGRADLENENQLYAAGSYANTSIDPGIHPARRDGEQVIDSMLRGHRRGNRFVYGIHQALSPGMMRALERRSHEAGLAKAVIRPGETGASIMILSHDPEA